MPRPLMEVIVRPTPSYVASLPRLMDWIPPPQFLRNMYPFGIRQVPSQPVQKSANYPIPHVQRKSTSKRYHNWRSSSSFIDQVCHTTVIPAKKLNSEDSRIAHMEDSFENLSSEVDSDDEDLIFVPVETDAQRRASIQEVRIE